LPSKFLSSLGRTLDARPDRLDLRDREYLPQVVSLPPRWPADSDFATWLPEYVAADLVLDQGEEGACTGFGLAGVVNYLLFRKRISGAGSVRAETVSTRMLYHLARFYDEWAGEDYEGSSCRGALKAWHKHGVCRDSLWPYRDARGRVVFIKPRDGWDADALTRTIGVYYRVNHASVVDMQAAIRQIGAIYVSATVHDGWNQDVPTAARRGKGAGRITHDSLPTIRPITDKKSVGGHAFALVGFNERGFVVQNSWGLGWGQKGFATLPYAEWTRDGDDAWVAAIGVPADLEAKLLSPSTFKPGAPRPLPVPAAGIALTAKPLLAPEGLPPAVKPLGIETAYRHTLVAGNDGRLINRLVTAKDAAAAAQEIVAGLPADWLRAQPATNRKLAVYAHGGLNSEEDSLRRVRLMAPYFLANDIYPLFLTWKTGPLETLRSLIEDQLQRVPRPEGGVWDRFREAMADALDRSIELVAGPVLKPVWTQMKQNAAAASQPGHGGQLLATGLADLLRRVPGVEIHLLGHSAGSIVLGHLLDDLRANNLRAQSCALYAPACTAQFALDHYRPAFARGTLKAANTSIDVLSVVREVEDTVGPYRKSLLWFVSRALESKHKAPIIGLEALYADKESAELWHSEDLASAAAWRELWSKSGGPLNILSSAQVSTGALGKPSAANHGCFDNAAPLIEASLRRIRGAELKHKIDWLDY
jgi:hypothetical protein